MAARAYWLRLPCAEHVRSPPCQPGSLPSSRALGEIVSASGGASAASASAGRPCTSRCCASCASPSANGSPTRSSSARSPPPTCCPGPHPRSWPSTAPGACGARAERCSAASAFILPGLVADPRPRPPSSCRARRPPGCAPPGMGAGAAVPAVACWRAGASPRRSGRAPSAARRARVLIYGLAGALAAALAGAWLVLVLLGSGLIELLRTAARSAGSWPRSRGLILGAAAAPGGTLAARSGPP